MQNSDSERTLDHHNFPFWIAVSVFLAVFASCLLTPLVYEALISYYAPQNVPWPFSRVFNRVFMLSAAVALFVFRRKLSLAELKPWFKVGSRKTLTRSIFFGIAISLAVSLLFFLILSLQGVLSWSEPAAARFTRKMIEAVFAGILISVIEESFFRVLLLQKLRRSLPFWVAAAVSSSIYAVVHFISPDKTFVYDGYSLGVGFQYFSAVIERVSQPGVPFGLFGLFLVGMGLCLVIRRARNLFFCIGLHAGWVMAMKFQTHGLALDKPSLLSEGLGKRYFLLGEPLGWLSIVVVVMIALFFSKSLTSHRDASGPG